MYIVMEKSRTVSCVISTSCYVDSGAQKSTESATSEIVTYAVMDRNNKNTKGIMNIRFER